MICPCNNRKINPKCHYTSEVHMRFVEMCRLVEKMYDEFLREQL